MADRVIDKTRANFCEWFQARRGPGTLVKDARMADLNALFDSDGSEAEGVDTSSSNPRAALDRLFKP